MTGGRRPRVVVIGLGPAGPDLVTAATLDAIDRTERRFLRTARHPSASIVPGARAFDDVYDRSASLDEVYRTIVEALIAAAADGAVLYAVPGSPVVAERTVELLMTDPRVAVEVVPAMSFLDLAWARLGVDPIAIGASIVDGQRFAVEAAGRHGPLLVAQCDSRAVLSDIKLSGESGAGEVTVLQHLGLPDERVFTVRWDELDRFEPDHLTSLFIPSVRVPVAAAFVQFDELVRTLRTSCPWDRAQTHESLRRHLIEESYEVLEALDILEAGEAVGEPAAGYDALAEELGDLLFQVFFHATIAAEDGWFTVADVARGIHDKLYARHPHVFGDVVADSADEVVTNWEQIKKAEKQRASVMDGIPRGLPALLYALKVQKKARAAGFGEPAAAPAAGGLVTADAVGEALFALVAAAERVEVDPEDALRRATDRHREWVTEREAGRG